jgi:hypothetical protein
MVNYELWEKQVEEKSVVSAVFGFVMSLIGAVVMLEMSHFWFGAVITSIGLILVFFGIGPGKVTWVRSERFQIRKTK